MKEGAYYVELYSKSFEEALGLKPYPGTLNMRVLDGLEELKKCLAEGEPVVVKPPVDKAWLNPVLAYPAELKTLPTVKVYLIRPLVTKHGDKVIELISNVSLREELKLKDGDVIVLKVCCKGGFSCFSMS
ncbi:MAG: DUF120 domain-containing protein [Acidilobaceae archaeon]